MFINLEENEKVVIQGYTTDIEILSGGREVLNGDIIKFDKLDKMYFCSELKEIIIHNFELKTWEVDGKSYPLIRLQ